MANSSFFEMARRVREIRFTGDTPGGRAVSAALAVFAREELAKSIAAGEASRVYDLFVNNRLARSEDEVRMVGAILYRFSWWEEIIISALSELVKRSPRKSGRYSKSFVVLVNGAIISPTTPISSSAEVIITNFQPYTRKVQVGAMEMTVPPRLFDAAKRALDRAFGGRNAGFNAQVKFLEFAPGVMPGVPYILKGAARSTSVAALARWHQLPPDVIRAMRARGDRLGSVDVSRVAITRFSKSSGGMRTFYSGRADTAGGRQLTYPSLVINLEA